MDVPKLKIILYRICMGVVIIWLLVVATWEYEIDNHFEAIGFPLVALLAIWQTIKSWHKPNWGGLPAMTIWMLYASFFYLPRDYTKHQDKLRLDKYGPVLNARRAKLEIPVIPANWEPGDYDDRYVTWRAKDSATGHQSKDIFLDSLHRLKFEDDTYNLKRADSVDRNLNIRTYFQNPGSSIQPIIHTKRG